MAASALNVQPHVAHAHEATGAVARHAATATRLKDGFTKILPRPAFGQDHDNEATSIARTAIQVG